jgi:hypothetical protein
LALPLLLEVDELFDVPILLLLDVPLEMLFVSDKVPASLSESELEHGVGEELSDERRVKMDDRRCLVDVRSSRAFNGLEGFRPEVGIRYDVWMFADIVVIVWSYGIVGEKDIYVCGGNVGRVSYSVGCR